MQSSGSSCQSCSCFTTKLRDSDCMVVGDATKWIVDVMRLNCPPSYCVNVRIDVILVIVIEWGIPLFFHVCKQFVVVVIFSREVK